MLELVNHETGDLNKAHISGHQTLILSTASSALDVAAAVSVRNIQYNLISSSAMVNCHQYPHLKTKSGTADMTVYALHKFYYCSFHLGRRVGHLVHKSRN